MKYADVSDANLYYGNMRFDVNVSVSKDPNNFGKRTETKNLNSFRAVEKAVEYEIKRQISVLEKGESVVQETRGWDDAKQQTFSQRSKEESHDYRYMPDPDIPPVVLSDDEINAAVPDLPVLPNEWREKLRSIDVDAAAVETLIEAEVEDPNVRYLPLVENNLDNKDLAKFIVNFFVNIEIPHRRNAGDEVKLDHQSCNKALLAVYELGKAGKLSSTKSKELFSNLLSKNDLPGDIESYASENGYIQLSDQSELEEIVGRVLEANQKAADDVANGEMKAIGFLVGQVMKESKGKANPQTVQEMIKAKLL
jgi:aspartyl-tRNA(Asn)/glutamyl-tRNA(Gln) amidotransferase subunit B